jgi:hypothetical protein
MIRPTLVALAALTLGAATTSDTRDLDAALKDRTPGTPQQCLRGFGSQTQNPQIISDRILLYPDGSRIWRNDLPAACPGLEPNAILVTEVRSGQLCRNDQVYTLQRGGIGIPGPRCRLGMFTPYSKAKRER